MPEMSPESRNDTGRPNLGLSLAALRSSRRGGCRRGFIAASPGRWLQFDWILVLRLIRRIEDLTLAACMPLEAAKEVAEIRALWPRKTAQWHW